MDYRPYRRTNPALSHLYHCIQCRHCMVPGISCRGFGFVYYRPYGRLNPALSYLYHCIQCRPCMLPGISCWRFEYLWIIDRTGGQILFFLTFIIVSSVDLACYHVSRAGDLGIGGLSTVQADKSCSISLVSLYPVETWHVSSNMYLVLGILVIQKCDTISLTL